MTAILNSDDPKLVQEHKYIQKINNIEYFNISTNIEYFKWYQ